MSRLTLDELYEGLAEIQQSPSDAGELRAIVIRPKTDHREMLTACEISLEDGVHGDKWATGCWKSLSDGRPHPDVQIAIMNVRTIGLIARTADRWPLAGDNLFIDLDLSGTNLPPGQQLSIGSAVIKITDEPHNGCRKFAERYGPDAVKFVNSDIGKKLHLRGIYARVVTAGAVHVGDIVRKV